VTDSSARLSVPASASSASIWRRMSAVGRRVVGDLAGEPDQPAPHHGARQALFLGDAVDRHASLRERIACI
jgi:hypothetical protein